MYSIDAHAKFDFKPVSFSATYGSKGIIRHKKTAAFINHNNQKLIFNL